MTILGVHLEADQAMAWCDSEILNSDSGSHNSFRNKMTVNALAGTVCMSTGWANLGDEAHAICARSSDLDHAARVLPERLRQTTMRLIRSRERDPRQAGTQVVCLAGWSPQASRMLAYRFDGCSMFEAIATSRICIPDVPQTPLMRELDPADLVRVAQAQIAELQVAYPEVTGGVLTVALVRPGSVTTQVIYDLSLQRCLLPVLARDQAPPDAVPCTSEMIRLAKAA